MSGRAGAGCASGRRACGLCVGDLEAGDFSLGHRPAMRAREIGVMMTERLARALSAEISRS